jgi:ribose transport system ATP-binding protein
MTAPLLSLKDVNHSYFGVPVNKNITVDVGRGEILGLVGENGAGKSTLMNILGGIVRPDSGEFHLDGEEYQPTSAAHAKDAGINFVHQELNLFDELSVLDNLFITDFPKSLGIFANMRKARSIAADALESVQLDVAPSTQVESMSPGQKQLLEFAKGLMGNPRVVILDEPTTSLTHRETTVMFSRVREMAAQGTSFIFVSHILEDVLSLCDRVAILRDGELVGVRNTRDTKTADLIELMVGKELEQQFPSKKSAVADTPVLSVAGLSSTGQFENVTFDVRRHEIVGLFGLMGSGRTELAKVVFGETKSTGGKVLLGEKDVTKLSTRRRIQDGLALVTEDRRGEGLLMTFPILPNAVLAAVGLRRDSEHALKTQKEKLTAVEKSTGELNLKASDLTQTPVEFLSGGNQQKVVLSKWDIVRPTALILDEPTRGIDVGAKVEVYRAIGERAEAGAGQLVISSELSELMGLADRILVMRLGKLVAEFARDQFDPREILGAAFGEEGVKAEESPHE